MKFSIKFPTPYTVLMIAIAISALATWLLPAGSYDRMTYNSTENTFEIQSVDSNKTIDASQEFLNENGIIIPLETFKSGKISKPISIPKTYK